MISMQWHVTQISKPFLALGLLSPRFAKLLNFRVELLMKAHLFLLVDPVEIQFEALSYSYAFRSIRFFFCIPFCIIFHLFFLLCLWFYLFPGLLDLMVVLMVVIPLSVQPLFLDLHPLLLYLFLELEYLNANRPELLIQRFVVKNLLIY